MSDWVKLNQNSWKLSNFVWLDKFGFFLSNGLYWVKLCLIRSKWFWLALNFTYWASRVKVDQNGSNWIKNGQIWFDFVKQDFFGQKGIIGSNCTSIVFYWFQFGLIGSYCFNKTKVSQVGFIRVQMGWIWPNYVQFCINRPNLVIPWPNLPNYHKRGNKSLSQVMLPNYASVKNV